MGGIIGFFIVLFVAIWSSNREVDGRRVKKWWKW